MAVTKEYRTKMYSYRETKDGEKEVVEHMFPWNANERYGMQKLQKMVQRGFMFVDPRKGGNGQPEVLITNEVTLEKPESFCPDCLADGREVLQEDCNFHKG